MLPSYPISFLAIYARTKLGGVLTSMVNNYLLPTIACPEVWVRRADDGFQKSAGRMDWALLSDLDDPSIGRTSSAGPKVRRLPA